ncbi:hypothetical protein [Bifidobacterium parmae]|uniref:Uncharacterized protein n=1 Tax=Bifidobacterium parmae TaxID=361854 RepID=A0A2N5IZZ4_9BIFI|nr:hypothetical protein [Bifidobacterium parmae]PLS27529.1 hypothetical protein Uis4E_1561 [Bifidobacterium parmae]
MKTLVYIPAAARDRADGTAVSLNDPDGLMVGQIMEPRTRSWNTSLGYRSLTATRPARTVKVTALCRDKTRLDTAEARFDADMRAYTEEQATPGLLDVDGWRQNALVTGCEPDYVSPQLTRVELTIALLDGVWHKPVTQSFDRSTARYTSGKDYPHDYRYDYMPSRQVGVIDNDSALPSRAKITIYGPAATPTIIIGANRIIADVTIPSGGYLVIDGTGTPRTATLVAANGDKTNVFATLHRNQAAGEYAFATIPPGRNTVSWDESFGFDIEYWLERTGLPWT